jgi:hypothetical protein
MKKIIIIFFLGAISFNGTYAQKLPAKELKKFFDEAGRKISLANEFDVLQPDQSNSKMSLSGAFQLMQKMKDLRMISCLPGARTGDTLFIGIPPNDSLIITGEYTYSGPILVIGNGVLRFKNAHATILGDLWVWGDNALVVADSSTLYFPQEYFYQRSLVIAGHGRVVYTNTTLDHSGLSHNLALTDSASIEMINVKNIGFTTCGLYGKPEVFIDRVNEAGEYVITDQAKLSFKNVKTLLLWHQVPATAAMNFSFPPGDSLHAYDFSNATPGVSGIGYTVHVENSTGVMWGLMPSSGSDITISDSKIRSIGLWFEGNDTLEVSGLVDNSNYDDFTASPGDRNLRLITTSVQTWSLYPMDNSNLEVTGCILGEIGTMGRSSVTTSGVFVDGSGGYWWATDTSFMVAGFCTGVNAVRSDRNAIFIFAYSMLNMGEATALGNSILMAIQSQLPEEPKPLGGSSVWYAYIGDPFSAYVDTLVPVYGSAWIDKTATSNLMDFEYYRMYYQATGETDWYPVNQVTYEEKRNEMVAVWDTHGLTPGTYILKLIICDNTPDSNKAEAVKAVNLLPRILSIDEESPQAFNSRIYPNPVTGDSHIVFYLPEDSDVRCSILDMSGKIIMKSEKKFSAGSNVIEFHATDLQTGVYYYILTTGGRSGMKKFVKI